MDGIINVYKEKGYTSFDVVAKLRGILHMKKLGHTGTLDPDAEGVLPVCIGKATRVIELLGDKDKTYTAVMKLGVTTDTLDMTGTITDERPVNVTNEEVFDAINSFIGVIEQIPPMYSALKVNGERLYDLARKGIEVEREARKVEIYNIETIGISLPYVTMSVECEKGTYIRTLCNDIGEKLGCGAAMESLVRTRACGFEIDDALKLDEIRELAEKEKIESYIMPLDQALLDYPSFNVIPDADRFLKCGNRINLDEVYSENNAIFNGRSRAYFSNGDFAGIYEYLEDSKEFKAVKLFV